MNALGFTKVLLEEFDESTQITKRSGKHAAKSDAMDKHKIVQELISSGAFISNPNRKYSVFKNIKPSLLTGFDYYGLHNWIDKHKDFLAKKSKARWGKLEI